MRNNLVLLFVGVLFFTGSVLAASGIARFVFTTDPQTVRPGELSGVLKIQAQDANNKEIKTEETIDVEFSSTSLTGKFLNASSSPARTWMNKGTANFTFYYLDSVAGLHTINIKTRGRDSGTSWIASQTINVSGVSASSNTPVPAALPPPPSPPPLPSGGSSSVNINVDAGPDQTVPAGSTAGFNGSAVGLKKEPLENGRFWWNFGDGETQEGKFITHVFRIPGTYIVGLHMNSGEYGASDYATVHVLANQMRVVSVVEGREGYLRFLNPLPVESDIGDWVIQDATEKKFFVPSKTKVAPGAEISFSNAVTGLLQTDNALYPLTVQYPNGTVAFTYVPAGTSSSRAVSVPVAAQVGSSSPVSNPEQGFAGKTKPARSFSKRNPPFGSHSSSNTKEDMNSLRTNLAALPGKLSISSRVLFAGAVGLSALGALGFFVLKHFLT